MLYWVCHQTASTTRQPQPQGEAKLSKPQLNLSTNGYGQAFCNELEASTAFWTQPKLEAFPEAFQEAFSEAFPEALPEAFPGGCREGLREGWESGKASGKVSGKVSGKASGERA